MKLCRALAVSFVFLAAVASSFAEDYYEVLGIKKDASLKEIRKAFKKLALTMHPDKNHNDPNAHDKFVRITEIYEVLKDEDMRKKYDKYGEEGLKDDKRGGRYESYNYYRDEFGIYDDDAEVVTLDGGDFDASVKSGEVWFVNFYSPRCSHCHQLAPTWRKFAEEFSGVVNIGAVNCGDNRWICSQNGIHSFPSLMLFRGQERWREFAQEMTGFINIGAVECSGKNRILCMKQRVMAFPNLVLYGANKTEPIKYQGDRSKKDLIRFIMEYVEVEVVDIWNSNVDYEVAERAELPWVVSFCGSEAESHEEDDDGEIEGDCPSRITRRKLAGLMNGLANVGSVDCGSESDLCKRANISGIAGVYHFPLGEFPDPTKGAGVHFFPSLDAREIYVEFMDKLVPGMDTISARKLEYHVSRSPALIFMEFSPDSKVEDKDTSLKKLPNMLKMKVGKVDCGERKDWCAEKFHLSQDAVLAFKGKGIDDFEVFHGKSSTAELRLFAQESSQARLNTLDPSHFDDGKLLDNEKPWFVDFFAPWCPPCRALLPELRKASQAIHNIKFGTVDCTNFAAICEKFHIQSYPTTMLFNGSTVTEYTGHHSVHGINQFVQDLISPPYDTLTPDTFLSMVQLREPGVTWVVDFYANWCGPCRALLPEWRRMAKLLAGVVRVGAIDCAKQDNAAFCRRHQVNSYPEIRLFPAKADADSSPLYEVHKGWNRQAHSLAGWALEKVPGGVQEMKASDFDNTGKPKDDGAFVLDFFAPWCGHCHSFAPKFTLTSLRFKGRVTFGKIDCQMLPSVCQKNGVRAYPTVNFYPPKTGKKRPPSENISSQDPDEITRLINSLMKQYEDKPKSDKGTKKKKKDEL